MRAAAAAFYFQHLQLQKVLQIPRRCCFSNGYIFLSAHPALEALRPCFKHFSNNL